MAKMTPPDDFDAGWEEDEQRLGPDPDVLKAAMETEQDEDLSEVFCNIFARELSEMDFAYLLRRYMYLGLRDATAAPADLKKGKLSKLPSGCLLLDAGAEILMGLGEYAFGSYTRVNKKGQRETLAGMTPFARALRCVSELFLLATERWDIVNIYGGYPPLQRYFYFIASNLNCTDKIIYDASDWDMRVLDRLNYCVQVRGLDTMLKDVQQKFSQRAGRNG